MVERLQEYVTQQAAARPEAAAVVLGASELSYGELDRASSQLAHCLRAVGCGRGDRVGLLMPKSPTAIVAMLGVLKADAMYVPMDPACPAERAARVISASEPWGILAASTTAPLLDEIIALTGSEHLVVGSLETRPLSGTHFESRFDWSDLAAYPDAAPASANSADDPAHLLFTSGSTGQPKGVVITHRNVIGFVEWARNHFGITAGERISGHTPLHFDLSTFDIYGTLSAGATLYLVPPQLNLLPHKLADFIRRTQLTQWFSVPSTLTFLAKHDAVAPNDFPSLKRLLWCGEVLPTPSLVHFMQRLPHVSFTNLYGPTEATIASSYHTVATCPQDARAPIPIGIACAGEQLRVLNGNGNDVPPGEIGEIFIGGSGLSPGYWRDPEKTAAAFRTDPATGGRIYRTGDLGRLSHDGLVYFLGRADSQIKSRGYRIELGEVEAAFHALDCLRESAIVAIPSDGFEGNLICCAYVSQPDVEVTPTGLKQQVGRLLPPYMLPARWLTFSKLPRNANGKVDRPRLKELFSSQPTGDGS